MLAHLDLFSGIGGFALGLERTGGFRTAAFCEIDAFPRAVLRKHWPQVHCFPDVCDLDGAALDRRGIPRPDIISAGYPCQPFSSAGKQGGERDDRHLWPEAFRLIEELRPRWFLGENVIGHVRMGLDAVLSDLEGIGYAAIPLVIPACSVGAPHKRDRVWIIAHADDTRRQPSSGSGQDDGEAGDNLGRVCAPASDADRERRRGGSAIGENATHVRQLLRSPGRDAGSLEPWHTEPGMGRLANGVPGKVDRIRAFGNAVVPQIVEMIGNAILEAEREFEL